MRLSTLKAPDEIKPRPTGIEVGIADANEAEAEGDGDKDDDEAGECRARRPFAVVV